LESQTPSGPVCENTNGTNYEVITLIKTDAQSTNFIPCGFLKNGQIRPIYGNSLIGRIKRYHHNNGTNPKLMVTITMYNEDVDEFKLTMRGIMQNYEVLCQDPKIRMKRNDLVVVLCCDGFDKIPQSFIDYLTELKALDAKLLREKGYAYIDEATGRTKMRPIKDFMEQGMENYPNNLLHVFGAVVEDFHLDDNTQFRGRKVNFVFALKHNNNGKINTFKWCFQGLAKYLAPQYIQKFDIGTRAGDYSLAKLYKHMEAKPECGGCCSEVVISTDNEKANSSWGAWWVTQLQYYEFKQTIAYFKTFEGWGCFVMALPGCYSLYRWDALKGMPLDRFFKLINMEQEPTCWEANEYLVEDRLLTNNVYYQPGAGYTTDFVINAQAYTDAPHNLELLMKQRRRWSNGFLFGELTTILNIHNILGFGGQKHSVYQRLKALVYAPILIVNKLMGWVNPAILLTQMKYMFIFAAYAHFDTPEYKQEHPDLWRFFTNDPSSMGFSSVMNLTVLFLLLVGVMASIGAQISQAMDYFRVILYFFQFYTICCLWGTISMLRSFGLWESSGNLNVYVAQFVLTWLVLLCPFYLKPIDAIQNIGSYMAGLPAYYLSFFWWYVIITVYSMCNLDDVTWGNRPANASKGLNVVVDDVKRQEILRQNYRTTRTHMLIWWLIANVSLMYMFDALVLSAVHNGNLATKESCQALIKGYAWYCLGNALLVLSLSAVHTFIGNFKLLLCGAY